PPLYLSGRRPGILGRMQPPPTRLSALDYAAVHPGSVRSQVPSASLPPPSMADTMPTRCSVKCHRAFLLNFSSFSIVSMMAGYSVMEDELLCDAWKIVSADFVGMRQGGSLFWQNMCASFLEQKHLTPYNAHVIHDLNVKLLAHR
uniref:Uncharacterized protein n=1 Tax=Aegilops tauschii subsp. strangulata TaxID=200361 RepID=A0A453RHM6_AEGTS